MWSYEPLCFGTGVKILKFLLILGEIWFGISFEWRTVWGKLVKFWWWFRRLHGKTARNLLGQCSVGNVFTRIWLLRRMWSVKTSNRVLHFLPIGSFRQLLPFSVGGDWNVILAFVHSQVLLVQYSTKIGCFLWYGFLFDLLNWGWCHWSS